MDKSFSRIQTTFIYDNNINCWFICDGKVTHQGEMKPSTNGTWIYAYHSFEISDETIFRIGNSKIKINLKLNK